MKNLRVAVVPTETGNGIDQNSTVQEIIDCPETRWFSVPDYFQAQNDEEIDLLHWSFLIDYEKLEHLNGTNVDGIDFHQRAQDIAYIKKVIAEHGEFTATEIEIDAPTVYSRGNTVNICELVEEFKLNGVETLTYCNDNEEGYEYYTYENEYLSDDLIAEIRQIVEDYEADCLKTEKRCGIS